MTKKAKHLLLVACVLLIGMVSYSSAADDLQLTFATGPTGGSFFPLGGTIAQMWNKSVDGVNVTAISTAAGFENLRLLETNDASFALLPESISYFGATGTGIAAKLGEQFKEFDVLARIYPEAVQIFAKKNSGINKIADFKGKKVSLGAIGGYQYLLGAQVFELAGLGKSDYKPSFTGYSVAGEQFQDGMIDGGFFLTGIPNSTLTQLAVSTKIKFIPVSDQVIGELKKEIPFASKMLIPASSYSSLDKDTQTFSIWTLLLVRKDTPEDLVYKLTKNLFEKSAEMAQTNGIAKWIDVANQKDISLPVHPGAQKYYQEQ